MVGLPCVDATCFLQHPFETAAKSVSSPCCLYHTKQVLACLLPVDYAIVVWAGGAGPPACFNCLSKGMLVQSATHPSLTSSTLTSCTLFDNIQTCAGMLRAPAAVQPHRPWICSAVLSYAVRTTHLGLQQQLCHPTITVWPCYAPQVC